MLHKRGSTISSFHCPPMMKQWTFQAQWDLFENRMRIFDYNGITARSCWFRILQWVRIFDQIKSLLLALPIEWVRKWVRWNWWDSIELAVCSLQFSCCGCGRCRCRCCTHHQSILNVKLMIQHWVCIFRVVVDVVGVRSVMIGCGQMELQWLQLCCSWMNEKTKWSKSRAGLFCCEKWCDNRVWVGNKRSQVNDVTCKTERFHIQAFHRALLKIGRRFVCFSVERKYTREPVAVLEEKTSRRYSAIRIYPVQIHVGHHIIEPSGSDIQRYPPDRSQFWSRKLLSTIRRSSANCSEEFTFKKGKLR
jgi:hypothetical protein